MLFGLLAAFYNAPEGVAAPLASSLGGGAAAVGVILAANALGQTVGTITFSRFVAPATRLRFMGPLAISACGVLVLFFWKPDLYVSLLILFTSGLCACYQLAANSSFVSAAPREQRSQAFGLAQGAMSLGQGVVMILAGAAAEHHASAQAIAVCGAIGVVAAFAVTVGADRDRGWLAGKRRQRALCQVQLLSRMAGLLWRAGRGVLVGSSGPVVVAHDALLSSPAGEAEGHGSGPVVVAHSGLLSVLGRWFGGQEVGVRSASATSTQAGTSLYVHI
jgi:MFS family permease